MTTLDGRTLAKWIYAVKEAQRGTLADLIKLLRSDFETSPSAHAAEQEGRKMLAALLEQRHLKKKRGGQATPLFSPSAKDRLEYAAKAARRLQHGQAIAIKDLLEVSVRKLSPQQSYQWRRGELKIPISHEMLIAKAKPKKRSEAIDIAAEAYTVDPLKLHNFMAGKTGFGRGARTDFGRGAKVKG